MAERLTDFVVIDEDDFVFGKNLADAIECECVPYKPHYYPDGEPSPALDIEPGFFDNAHILLVGRFKQRPTRYDVTLRWHNFTRILENLRDSELNERTRVDVLFPYFWLGRQDHNPRTDPDIRIRERDRGKDRGYVYVAKTLRMYGAERIVTFNPHFHRTEGIIQADGIGVICLDAIPALAEYARGRIDKNSIVIGPDLKSSDLIKEFAEALGLDSYSLDKVRLSDSKVHHHIEYDTKERPVVIVDDIFSTAGTIEGTLSQLSNNGTVDIYIVHAIMPQIGYDRALNLTRYPNPVRDLVATNTVESDYSRVDITQTFVRFLKENP